MASGVRDFLNSKQGQAVSITVIVIGLALLAWSFKSNLGSEIASSSSDRMFVDSTTGKAFAHVVSIGEKMPVVAPSGGNTGFPGEPCYWTADGKVKAEPTWVLLNDFAGKPGPTFCPDCGRLVVAHNPSPGQGIDVPPTQAEYQAKKAAKKE